MDDSSNDNDYTYVDFDMFDYLDELDKRYLFDEEELVLYLPSPPPACPLKHSNNFTQNNI